MAEVVEEGVPSEEQQQQLSSPAASPEDTRPAASPEDTQPAASTEDTQPTSSPEDTQPAARTEDPQPAASLDKEERAAEGSAVPSQYNAISVDLSAEHFLRTRFFVLRPGTLNHAIKDIEALVDKEVDGSIQSIWLMAEVDHWNNEKERLVLITESSLLVFKYDFVMLKCEQIQRIPLNFVDRISHGTFSFPKRSLLQREGEGMRIFWDRLREPSFTSKWNPFATDFPFITFTYHPVRNSSDTLAALCDIQNFREQLKAAAEKVHSMKPMPGKANGVMILNQPIHVEAYVGLMSFLGNQNKLGYCMARGNIGF